MLRALGCLLLAVAGVACTDTTTEPDPAPPGAFTPGPDKIAFSSDRDGISHIYVANLDGSEVARLVPGFAPAWSWDGRRIAFARDPAGIWVLNADGSEKRLATGLDPDWSPDDREIVFVRDGDLFLVASDGSSAPRRLLGFGAPLPRHPLYQPEIHDGTGYFLWPKWSPDGRQITFDRYDQVSDEGGISSAYVMNADGTSPRLLNEPCQIEHPDGGIYHCVYRSPTWFAEGSKIGVTLLDFRGHAFVSIDAAQLQERRILFRGAHSIGSTDWSPDGRRVLFSGIYGVGDGDPPDLHMRISEVTLETGAVRQVIPDAVNPEKPDYGDWGPVRSRLAR